MKRRGFRQKHRPEDAYQEPWFARVPAGAYWTLVTLVVLGLVLNYDSRQQRHAKDHVEIAQELEQKGQIEPAVEEYREALGNERFSRKRRGEVALHVAQLYADKLNNPERARYYYNRARFLYPKIVDDPEIRHRFAQLGASGKMAKDPAADRAAAADVATSGPVVAHIGEIEIRAGEVHRAFRDSADYASALRSGDVNAIQDIVSQHVENKIVHLAAVDGGMEDDPEISDRVEQFRQQLIRDKYRLTLHSSAAPDDSAIRAEYEKNKGQYTEPGRVSVGLIKVPNQQRAAEAQEQLRAGVAFEDVATSFTTDALTSASRGMLGYIDENSGQIPGVGHVPSILKTLMAMRPNQVSQPLEHAGAFYIFKVYNVRPGKVRTLSEVRSSIEAELQKNIRLTTVKKLDELKKKYGAAIDANGMKQYVQFANMAARSASASASNSNTTTSSQSTTATVAAAR